MPYPNTTASVIVISQTSGSSIGGQFPFIERQISGSNLFLLTDANGFLTGSTTIPGGTFTNLNVASLTASVISASTGTFSGTVTVNGLLSASNGLTASNIYDAGTLVVLGGSNITTLTASVISASGGVTTTTLTANTSIVDNGNLTVFGSTTLGDTTSDSVTITGSLLQSGSYSILGNISASGIISASQVNAVLFFGTASMANSLNPANTYSVSAMTVNGLLSASGGFTASNIYDAGTLTIVGNTIASTITGALSGSSVATGNATIAGGTINGTTIGVTTPSTGNFTNLTASNISASNTLSASNAWMNNLTVAGTLTATVSGSITSATSASITANNSIATIQYIPFVDGTGTKPLYIDQDSLTWLPSTNTLSSSGAVSASGFNASGNIAVNGGTISTVAATLTLANTATTIAIGGATTTASHAGIIDVTDTTAATILGAGSIQTDGGIYIGKNLIVSGSTTLFGDVTMFGTGSIINISSSTLIIGDNRISLNAWSVGAPQRYGGIDIFDSGSSTSVTSSILWDSLNNYWLLQTNASGSPVITSSAIMLQGPTSSFGSENLMTVNYFPKAQTTTGNMITSSLSEVGTSLQYAGTISASVISGSRIYSDSGSFINLNVFTGSSPGVGNVPSAPGSAGVSGQIEVDNNYIYVYTNNLWKRVPLSVWTA